MRKGIAEGQGAMRFDLKTLAKLEGRGYKYVQIKGLTVDKHYDYIEPRFMVLMPLKELPADPDKKDIYEPIESKILQQWAREENDHFEVVIGQAV